MGGEADSDAPETVEEVLDCFEEAAEDSDQVSVEELMDSIGRRSFGPLILMAGIVMSAPGISDIPSVGTITGIFVGLVAGQMVFGRNHFWLPRWLLRRKVSSSKIRKVSESKWVRRPAGWIDRVVTERLEFFAGPKAGRVVATLCLILAVACPMTEFVPLSGVGVGAALMAFGLSLVARDGLMTLIGSAITAATLVIVIVVLT
jgi:hypothetical protein